MEACARLANITMLRNRTLQRIAKPANAIRQFRGLTIIDTFKIFLSLVIGYFTIFIFGDMSSRIGVRHVQFIANIASLKYVVWKSPEGLYFKIRPTIEDYWTVSLDWDWEKEVKHVFTPKQGEVIIDVGAHIGAYTIRHAKIVGKDGLVIALEPDPENFRLLNENVKLNKLSNVVALRMAAYGSDGTSILYRKGSSEHSLISAHHEEFNGEINVPTITFDTLVRKFDINGVDWVKIDVEGAELAVLEGASNVLRIIRNLVVEVWYENAEELLRMLRQEGYKIAVLSCNESNMYVLAERKSRAHHNEEFEVLGKRARLECARWRIPS